MSNWNSVKWCARLKTSGLTSRSCFLALQVRQSQRPKPSDGKVPASKVAVSEISDADYKCERE